MARPNEQWTVGAHGPIEKLEPNLWRVQADTPGMGLKRVMTLAKMRDGRVIVHNAVPLGDAEMAEIETWGAPAFVVVPNGYHRLDCKPFKARYPTAQVVCPRAATARVSQIVPVDLTYDQFPSDDSVTLQHVGGTGDAEGVLIVRSDARCTLVFNDLLFNMPHVAGIIGFVLKHITSSTGGPRISRIARWFVIKDKAQTAAALRELAQTPGLTRIVVSHHAIITENPSGVLASVAATLAS